MVVRVGIILTNWSLMVARPPQFVGQVAVCSRICSTDKPVTDNVFQALTPSVLGKGQIVAITTPAGRVGWFPDLWFQGLGLRIVARSTDLPRLADVVARDRKIMREGQFRQEHSLEFAG